MPATTKTEPARNGPAADGAAGEPALSASAAAAPARPRPVRAERAERPSLRLAEPDGTDGAAAPVAVAPPPKPRPPKPKKRSRKLLDALAGAKRVAVVTHDNPDPDAIGSCMGLRALVSAKLGVPADIICRQAPRAGENRVAADVSGFTDTIVTAPDWSRYDRIVLIDTQPGSGINPLPPDVQATAAVDHHGIHGSLRGLKYRDIRRSFGATASIVTHYLIEQNIEIDPVLGAALLFGIEVDTRGLNGHQGPEDDKALSRLHLVADKKLLNRMRYARLPQPYFEAFLLGLQGAFIYEDCIIAYLGDLESPEMTAIVADFLLRFEGITRVLCMGSSKGECMILSLRTADVDDDAGKRMASLVRGYGAGGGHRAKAGGKIPFVKDDADSPREVYELVRRRLLRMLGVKAARGRRLVQKKDIVDGLEWR
jgi:nanoRNase/pAp phosphatase (c-di-AMP/oligoRNAs hydrolase)